MLITFYLGFLGTCICDLLTGSASELYNITGSGGTFPASVYQTWGVQYPLAALQRNVIVKMAYNAIGSGAGKAAIIAKQVTYGASDAALSSSELTTGQGNLRSIPILVGAIVLVYYLPNYPNNLSLILTRSDIVGIFNGTITNWNDTSLVINNPQLAMYSNTSLYPDCSIRTVGRSDSSGSTWIFTSALSSFDSNWNSSFGPFMQSSGWPVTATTRIMQSGNNGIGVAVMRNAFSIGYIEHAYAIQYQLPIAYIQNRNGFNVLPSPTSLASAINDFASIYSTVSLTNFYINIVDGPGNSSYPLAGLTYLELRTDWPNDCNLYYELFRYIYWALTDTQAAQVAIQNNFLVLTPALRSIAFQILGEFQCSNGINLFEYVQEMIRNESEDTNARLFFIALIVTCVIVVFAFAWTLLYCGRKRKQRILKVEKGEKMKLSLIDAYSNSNRDEKFRRQIWLTSSYVIVHVFILVLDWTSYFSLPNGLLLINSYLVVVSLGSFILFSKCCFEIYSLYFEISDDHNVFVNTKTEGREKLFEIEMLKNEVGRILHQIISVSFDLMAALILDLPIQVLTLLIMQSGTKVNMIVCLAFGFSCVSIGWSLQKGAKLIGLVDVYVKGSNLVHEIQIDNEKKANVMNILREKGKILVSEAGVLDGGKVKSILAIVKDRINGQESAKFLQKNNAKASNSKATKEANNNEIISVKAPPPSPRI